MELSRQAILRSLAAWSFAHTQLVNELAVREQDSPEIVETVWEVFSKLYEEFTDEADAETDDITQITREEYERMESELVHRFRRLYAQQRKERVR